jgi:hypothetical protein
MATSSLQFGRSISLLLNNGSDVLDLSNLRIRFQISASDVETPNTAIIRVYNLRDETTQFAVQEFSQVKLSAGYGENIDQIFSGTVKQFRRGKERNVDKYLDIFAADGDVNYNFGLSNSSISANSTPEQRVNKIAQDMGVSVGQIPTLQSGGILPRGKVMFGLSRIFMRQIANSNQMRWSIQNGQLTLIPLTGYLPGEAVVVNSATGMIGIPEATDQGITVTMLLNPKVRIGQQLQINNADIAQTTIKEQFFPGYTDFNFVATVDSSTDGIYRVIVAEHSGDTRDTEWFTKAICLLIDQSSAPEAAVAPFG